VRWIEMSAGTNGGTRVVRDHIIAERIELRSDRISQLHFRQESEDRHPSSCVRADTIVRYRQDHS